MKRTPRETHSRASVSADAQRLLELLNALGSTTFRQLLWQKAAELELTYAQSQVLFYVGQHPGCHMGEVARGFGVTLPAITRSWIAWNRRNSWSEVQTRPIVESTRLS